MIISLLFSCSLQAAELTLAEVHEAVSARLPLILEAKEKLAANQAEVTSAAGEFDFRLKLSHSQQQEGTSRYVLNESRLEKLTPHWGTRLSVGHRQGHGDFAPYDLKQETSSQGELFAGFEIPLLQDRAIDQARLNLKQAKLTAGISQLELEQQILQLKFKSAAAYWKWVEAGHRLKLYRELLGMAQKRQGWLEAKLKLGDTSHIQLVDNRRILTKRQADLLEAEREFLSTSALLQALIARPALSESSVPVMLPHIDAGQLLALERRMHQLPSLKALRIEQKKIAIEKNFAKSQRLPNLKLMAEGARDIGELHPHQKDSDTLRAGIRFDFPLENNKAEGKLASLEHKERALTERLRWFEREWQASLTSNEASLRKLSEQAEAQRSEIIDTTAMRQAEDRKVRLGDSDLLVLNLREQDETEAKLRYLKTRISYLISVAERRQLLAVAE